MRNVIIAVGVDRSGSSLCANLLQECGVDLGDDLVGANEFNVKGYFESAKTLTLNDGVLGAVNCSWDTLYGLHPLEPAWWQSPPMEVWLEQIVDLLRCRMARTEGLFAFKDPRFCALLPIWQKAFSICDLSPHYVVTVRHPRGVAKSLATRNGFSREYAELYWLEHFCFASDAIGDAPYLTVHYEDWFSQPVEQARTLLEFLGLGTTDFEARLHAVIDQRLRHCNRSDLSIQLESVESLYRCLRSGRLPGPAEVSEMQNAEDVVKTYTLLQSREESHEPLWGNNSAEAAEVLAS